MTTPEPNFDEVIASIKTLLQTPEVQTMLSVVLLRSLTESMRNLSRDTWRFDQKVNGALDKAIDLAITNALETTYKTQIDRIADAKAAKIVQRRAKAAGLDKIEQMPL